MINISDELPLVRLNHLTVSCSLHENKSCHIKYYQPREKPFPMLHTSRQRAIHSPVTLRYLMMVQEIPRLSQQHFLKSILH
jgi:hypothetical protein